jgi:hypothetical protein
MSMFSLPGGSDGLLPGLQFFLMPVQPQHPDEEWGRDYRALESAMVPFSGGGMVMV